LRVVRETVQPVERLVGRQLLGGAKDGEGVVVVAAQRAIAASAHTLALLTVAADE
jgi:hypothetical protein